MIITDCAAKLAYLINIFAYLCDDMDRRGFLKASGALLPLSVLGLPTVSAFAQEAANETVGTSRPEGDRYTEGDEYKAHAGKLRFNPDGKFKIVQFTDTHWVPGNPASQETVDRMNEVLDAEHPDLVIYTGDIAYGPPAREGFEKCLEPAISRGIPFAVTLGNHDDEHDMTRGEIYSMIGDMPGNLTGTVPGVSGVTNFALPITQRDGSRTAFVIYGFDSLAYSPLKEVKGYDWIKHDQIEWYRRCSADLTGRNGGEPLPALSFFHIPLPEFNEAASDEGAKLIGTRGEKAYSPDVNSGLFTAMLEAGDVMGVVVGHDHVNDYAALWKGILLLYGRYTGGATVYNDIPGGNGARVIELTEGKRSFRSWIRLSGNRVVSTIDFPADFIKNED
jgi:hypothetical protein